MNAAQNVVTMERTCNTCEIPKPIADFHRYGAVSHKCNECFRVAERSRQRAKWKNDPEYRERHNLAGKAYRRGEFVPKQRSKKVLSFRTCKVCCVEKPIKEFPLNTGGHRLKACAVCYKARLNDRLRDRYASDPDYRAKQSTKAKISQVRSRYGVELSDVVRTLEEQHHMCANRACGAEISLTALTGNQKRAVIDHDHTTGKFRALLCDHCNILLGHIEASPNRALGLLEYADKFKKG